MIIFTPNGNTFLLLWFVFPLFFLFVSPNVKLVLKWVLKWLCKWDSLNNWLVQFQTTPRLSSSHHLPSRSNSSFFCLDTFGDTPVWNTTGHLQNPKIPVTSCLAASQSAIMSPVARLQCWDGVSWVAEVPSRGEGRAEESVTLQLSFETHL